MKEFWVGNEEFVDMYKERLGDAGYINFMLARTNNRGDGMLRPILSIYTIWIMFPVLDDL